MFKLFIVLVRVGGVVIFGGAYLYNVGVIASLCIWYPDHYFSGCTPADIVGKKKRPSARPLETTPLIVTPPK